ncbi:kinesin-like protein KIF23 [Euwallacea similis]|uniref:kinesin-like protein KIF23 n=1 Tax=Euwallacea similis TaxID=1736056 RepID=UPI00344F8B1F
MYSANRFNTPSAKKLRREKTTLSNNSDSDKDSVHVYCRIRPQLDGSEPVNSLQILSADTLALTTPETRSVTKETHYTFKHIFTAYSSQSEIFTHVAYPLLEDLLQGKNGLLFTYGVTGSGKTYTLNGTQNDPGIMPRCIDVIFNSIGEYQAPKCMIKSDRMNGFEIQSEDDAFHDQLQSVRSFPSSKVQRKVSAEKVAYVNDGTRIIDVNENSSYAVFISYVEIYNNSVYDLLDESSGRTLQNKILREDSVKNMYVNGVIETEVKSAQEAFGLFTAGQNRKRMATTSLNSGSSRSHSIFNIRVVQIEQGGVNSNGQPTIPAENNIKVGQLSLVDLAGSERTNRTNNTGMRLKEASSINNSLMTLRICLEILRENQLTKGNKLVPYRDSRLTFLFKHFFEGDGTVKMIVCINPSPEDFEENIQVLKFAEISQDVKISKAEINRYTPLKKTITRNKENQTPAKRKTATNFSLLPPIPSVNFDFENFEECREALDKVINMLKQRQSKVKYLDKEVEERQQEFRKKLVGLNKHCILNTAEMKSLKTAIQKEKQKAQNLHVKMSGLESANQDLQSKHEEFRNVIASLQSTINEKDMKINQFVLDRQKSKQLLALQSEKMTHELDVKLRRQRDHLNAAMKAKDEKIKLVKGILDSELPPVEMNTIDIEPDCTSKPLSSQTPKSTSHMHRRNLNAAAAARSRRSRSVGDVWLEHNVIKPCPLATVMQPTMKKRKSVSKLDKASDIINRKQSKYCLVAQEPDTDGEMETKLYKADIIPTCGGGAQVIFNDVERLNQESPTKSS